MIWYRQLSYQMKLTSRLMSVGIDDVTRDVTRCQDDERQRLTLYGVCAAAMLLVLLPVIVTSALGTTKSPSCRLFSVRGACSPTFGGVKASRTPRSTRQEL